MRKFGSEWLSGTRSFRGLTGVTPDVYRTMVAKLRPGWDRLQERKRKSGRPHKIGGLEEHLLVLLILYRCHITQEFMGVLYGVDKSCICNSLKRIEPLACRTLGVTKSLKVSEEEAHTLIVDCTEQPIQRPQKKQRCWYSGKKKRHTVKNEIIVTDKGRIASASGDMAGRRHDIEVRRRGPPLPEDARVYADSGYQGYQEDHKEFEIPYKRSKKKPLTKDQKEYNRVLSSFRVLVENILARMKRYRILSDRYRYARSSHARKFAIIAGITNLMAGF